MNYGSQLFGWAFDRALNYHATAKTAELTLDQTIGTAKKLAEVAYKVHEDWQDAGQYLLELAEKVDVEQVEAFVAHLSMIHERRAAQAERLSKEIKKAVGQA